jgi:hypothetical protein
MVHAQLLILSALVARGYQDDPKLIAADQAWTAEEDSKFAFMSFVWQKGQDHYHLRHFEQGVSPHGLFEKAIKVPRDYYMPFPPVDLIKAPDGHNDSSVYYLKQPALVGYDPESPSSRVAEFVLHEAKMCQRITPHENVCRYLGYIPSEDGRIAALCFERHGQDLGTVARNNIHEVDIEKVITQVTCGAKHLHSLGLVHVSRHLSSDPGQNCLQNDINAYNIVKSPRTSIKPILSRAVPSRCNDYQSFSLSYPYIESPAPSRAKFNGSYNRLYPVRIQNRKNTLGLMVLTVVPTHSVYRTHSDLMVLA